MSTFEKCKGCRRELTLSLRGVGAVEKIYEVEKESYLE